MIAVSGQCRDAIIGVPVHSVHNVGLFLVRDLEIGIEDDDFMHQLREGVKKWFLIYPRPDQTRNLMKLKFV